MIYLHRDKYSKEHWDFLLEALELKEEPKEEILLVEVKTEGVVRYYLDEDELESNEQKFDRVNGYS